jgi:integrase
MTFMSGSSRCDVRNTLGLPRERVAGVRNIALPDFLVEELRTQMKKHAGPGPEGLLFRGERGAMLRRGNFDRATNWPETVVKAGLPVGFHFHDLRHTGNQLAANSGATTRELMHRMGQCPCPAARTWSPATHGSVRAALIYQHASIERDRRRWPRSSRRERQPGGNDPDGRMTSQTPANRTRRVGAHFHDRK